MDMDLDERTLRRIIATLVALAALAERAAVRSFMVRWFVLALLRRAEAVVVRYALEETGLDEPFFDDHADGSAAEGVMLAWRMRWLASLLGALLDQACARHGWTPGLDGPHPLALHARPLSPAVAGCGAFQPFDTS